MREQVEKLKADITPGIKGVLRTTDELFDFEIEALIDSAADDMARLGVSEECFSEGSPYRSIVVAAVICYCKAHFGMDNPNAESEFFDRSYRQHVIDLLNSTANPKLGASDEVE